MAFVDFTNPAACKWYQSKLEALVALGVDSFKVCPSHYLILIVANIV
jgi:hypothetical protein